MGRAIIILFQLNNKIKLVGLRQACPSIPMGLLYSVAQPQATGIIMGRVKLNHGLYSNALIIIVVF